MQVESRKLQSWSFRGDAENADEGRRHAEFTNVDPRCGKNGIFIYDEDGAFGGVDVVPALPLGEFLEDDASLTSRRQLGLRPTPAGVKMREMWLAVQKLK